MLTSFVKILLSFIVVLFSTTAFSQQNQDMAGSDILQNSDDALILPQLENPTNNLLPVSPHGNKAYIIQNGSNQQAYIQQVQSNQAVVYQGGGDGNFLNLTQSGDRNVSVVVQNGSGNRLDQNLESNNSGSIIFQKGDNNVIQQQFYTDDLRYAITQLGNDNKVIQTDEGTGNTPPKLGIIQKGNGMELRIIQGNIDYSVAPQQ